jgi:sigma-B regulation protein RsbU (phosphoserine phosphatase)
MDMGIIMDDLLELLLKEFKLAIGIISLVNPRKELIIRSSRGIPRSPANPPRWHTALDSYLTEALLSKRPQFVNDTLQITKPRLLEALDQEGIRSFAHIPIAREGEPPVGVLSVYSRSIVGLFNQPFLDLLTSLAGQLAQAIRIDSEIAARDEERREKEKAILENVRVARDMEIARQIQLSLLPPEPPHVVGVQLAARCVSATQVGGDYYDFFLRSEHELEMVIADVSGHSVGSALIMAEARSLLRAQVERTESLSGILASLNQLLYEDLTRAELFITMFFLKYDGSRRMATYANAGHNRPIIARADQSGCIALDTEGMILGVRENVSFEELTIQLQPGDVLLIYTDGIVEAQDETGELFGDERLCRLLKSLNRHSPEEIINTIMHEVSSFTAGGIIVDDISMIVMRVA